ncbi:MAG: hypothetical protein AAGJ68_11605 [Pseudomonadota bacterium]
MDPLLFSILEGSALLAIGIFTTVSVVFYFHKHHARWLLIAACFVWPFVVWYDTSSLVTLWGYAIPSVVSGLVGLAAVGWGVTLRERRHPKLLFLPSVLAVLGYATCFHVEIPRACTQHARFEIGGLFMKVPRDTAVESQAILGWPRQAWYGRYNNARHEREDMRRFCAVTNGGRDVLHVYHLRFSFSNDLVFQCRTGSEVNQRLCEARHMYSLVDLYWPTNLDLSKGRHPNNKLVDAALRKGEREGFVCANSYCSSWFFLDGRVLAVAWGHNTQERSLTQEDGLQAAKLISENHLSGMWEGRSD